MRKRRYGNAEISMCGEEYKYDENGNCTEEKIKMCIEELQLEDMTQQEDSLTSIMEWEAQFRKVPRPDISCIYVNGRGNILHFGNARG